MDGENEEPKKFNYPGSDSSIAHTDKIVPEDPKPEVAKPVVHITDVLNQGGSQNRPAPTVRTFQSDVANTVKNDDVSVIKIALAEKRRQEKQGNLYAKFDGGEPDRKAVTKKIVIIGIVVGILVVVGLVGYNFLAKKISLLSSEDTTKPFTSAPATSTPSKTATSTKGIQVDVQSIIDVTGKNPNTIASLIKAEREKNIDLGAIRDIKFVEKANGGNQNLNASRFLSVIQARVDDDLVRALYPQFAFGIYSFRPRDSFMILYVDNYPSSYAGMLAWEQYMEDDLKEIIIRPTLGTSTKSADIFVDRVVNNRDARVLFDEDGNYKILYTFFDQRTIIIAPNERVLKEVVLRLTSGKIIR